jgi:hypothetical protein
VTERYAMAWGRTTSDHRRTEELERGAWRPTQHAAVLDAVDLLWRESSVEQVQIFCEDELVSTLYRSDPRISATLAALEYAVRDIYEEDSA